MALTSARGLALVALRRWRKTREFADTVIGQILAGNELHSADRAFAQEIFYGVLRHRTLLDFYVGHLRQGNLNDDTRDVLRLGLYQLLALGTPEHAAVFETTSLAPPRSRGLVNGVLRNAIRRRPELETAAVVAPLHVRASHPEFLVDRWEGRFGRDDTTALCRWNNRTPPLYARINTLRIEPNEFVRRYPQVELQKDKPFFIRAEKLPRTALLRGHCYMQDPSTAAAIRALEVQPGQTVLDACAAPGGKSGYIAALVHNEACLTVCDRGPKRVNLLRRNLDALGVAAEVIDYDWNKAPRPAALRDRHFDRILLDAPCSNTGVMRRRVDLRWRLRPEDFIRMPRTQSALAHSILPLLKPGGVFVYSTCSIEREENEEVVTQIMTDFPKLSLTTTSSTLPFRDCIDGAYVARFISA